MRLYQPVVSVLLASSFSLLVACSDDSAAGASAADGVTETAQAAGLCTEIAALPERCSGGEDGEGGEGSACVAKLAAMCDGFTDLLNPKLVETAASCIAESSCESAPLSCLAKMAGVLEPTEAQTRLAKAFCDSCSPVSGAACEKTFLSTASPLGKVLLPLGDDVASAIESECATGLACAASFAGCAQGIVAAKLGERLDKDAVECLLSAMVGVGGDGDGAADPDADDEGGSGSSDGSLPPTDEPTWDLYIDRVVAPATSNGASWDAFGGLPDLVVRGRVEVNGGSSSNEMTAPVDSLTASFSAPLFTNVPASLFTAPSASKRLRITVVDADVAFDDPVGDCAVGPWDSAGAFSPASWSLGTATVTCAATANGGPGYTLIYALRPHGQ